MFFTKPLNPSNMYFREYGCILSRLKTSSFLYPGPRSNGQLFRRLEGGTARLLCRHNHLPPHGGLANTTPYCSITDFSAETSFSLLSSFSPRRSKQSPSNHVI